MRRTETEHHKERDEYIEMVHQKDKEIAELKDLNKALLHDALRDRDKIRGLKRALYKACANWAKAVKEWAYSTPYEKWEKMETKCLAMAEKWR